MLQHHSRSACNPMAASADEYLQTLDTMLEMVTNGQDTRTAQKNSGLPHSWPVSEKASGGTPDTSAGAPASAQMTCALENEQSDDTEG